jgi:hypothetical protein
MGVCLGLPLLSLKEMHRSNVGNLKMADGGGRILVDLNRFLPTSEFRHLRISYKPITKTSQIARAKKAGRSSFKIEVFSADQK